MMPWPSSRRYILTRLPPSIKWRIGAPAGFCRTRFVLKGPRCPYKFTILYLAMYHSIIAISRKAVEQSITLPNIPLYSFKPPNKVDQFRTISNQPKYISLHQRHGKGTSTQNHLYSCSSCRRQRYVIEPRRTEKGTDRLLFQIVDPEHDRSLRSQRQI